MTSLDAPPLILYERLVRQAIKLAYETIPVLLTLLLDLSYQYARNHTSVTMFTTQG